ncbi:serine O-acetyltransferase [Candidatus Sumerlaeota bacterium]|nr:serine O-acetyltransferase [Candidatus Sumerlaeota bacterium]
MANTYTPGAEDDPIWQSIREAAENDAAQEPMLASYLYDVILKHDKLEGALSFKLANKLGDATIPAISIREIIDEALDSDPEIGAAVRADLQGAVDRDPACQRHLEPLLYFKGFHALESYRIAHWLWRQGRTGLALYLQSRMSEIFAVDIHPAARIGKAIFIDHATGVVIGETAVVEDCVSILHEVTLGGTGKATGDRHPKVRRGVLIGAGSKLLGNIEIGEGAKIGGGSVVLGNVPPHVTVIGVPAEIIGGTFSAEPALEMNHQIPVRKKDRDASWPGNWVI